MLCPASAALYRTTAGKISLGRRGLNGTRTRGRVSTRLEVDMKLRAFSAASRWLPALLLVCVPLKPPICRCAPRPRQWRRSLMRRRSITGAAFTSAAISAAGSKIRPGPIRSPGANDSFNNSGFLGGAQVGVNTQFNWLVLGLEGDFSWTSDIKGTGTDSLRRHHHDQSAMDLDRDRPHRRGLRPLAGLRQRRSCARRGQEHLHAGRRRHRDRRS